MSNNLQFLDANGLNKYHQEGVIANLDKKVDKVEGKGLSTNDFTNTYKDKLDTIEDNLVIKKGESLDSFIQNIDDNNHFIELEDDGEIKKNISYGPSSSAIGYGATAGIKGYYWTGIDFTNKTLYISSTQPGATLPTFSEELYESDFINPYSVGDVFSIVNGSKYTNCATIDTIDHNRMMFTLITTIPANEQVAKGDSGIDAYAFYVLKKPGVGEVELGHYAHAEGENTEALERSSHAEGRQSKAHGQYSHAEGRATEASGYCSHTEGQTTRATNQRSHAEGASTLASGKNAHAEGENTIASGYDSHAEGLGAEALGNKSHAEGTYTKAIGEGSHAEGSNTQAVGGHSHAQGFNTVANGPYSYAGGNATITKIPYQTVVGKFNNDDVNTGDFGSSLFVVGCGTSDTDRKNAFAVREDGQVNVYTVPKYDNNVMTRNHTSIMIDEKLSNFSNTTISNLQSSISTLNNRAFNLELPWKDKRWFIIGDEINYKYNDPYTTQYYHKFITDATGIYVYNTVSSDNTGFLGSSAVDTSNPNYTYRSGCIPARIRYNIDNFDNADSLSRFDVITIFTGGRLDCTVINSGRSIGDPYEYNFDIYNEDGSLKLTDSDTLCYRIHATITEVLKNCPDIQLVIATPIPSYEASASGVSDEDLEEYTNAIIEVCHVRGIPCLDLYHNSGLQPAMENSYGPQLYNDDLKHLNVDGHKKIAPRFKAMLDTLLL